MASMYPTTNYVSIVIPYSHNWPCGTAGNPVKPKQKNGPTLAEIIRPKRVEQLRKAEK